MTARRAPVDVLLRVVGAVVGGYAFSAAAVALAAVLLRNVFDWHRSEAVLLASMLGFVFYLGLLLWAFTTRRTGKVLAVTAGGAVVIYALLQLLPRGATV